MPERDSEENRCACGVALPVHMAKLGITNHICSCSRHYRIEDGKFIVDGIRNNPFAGMQ